MHSLRTAGRPLTTLRRALLPRICTTPLLTCTSTRTIWLSYPENPLHLESSHPTDHPPGVLNANMLSEYCDVWDPVARKSVPQSEYLRHMAELEHAEAPVATKTVKTRVFVTEGGGVVRERIVLEEVEEARIAVDDGE
ncbi:hypothetical protein HK104_006195 [Borealophlyctis nickersoniae]|nr:hypothetical protein HK104_006195 [Borealophlyctis nickersoniae]